MCIFKKVFLLLKEEKIAYVMHVDWNWIKQRPHFLAEELSSQFSLDLFFIRNYKQNRAAINVYPKKMNSITVIHKVPFSAKNILLQSLEKSINRKNIKALYKEQYDYLIVTSPIILQYIDLEKIKYKKLIYDCMDDHISFTRNNKIRDQIYRQEQRILKIADIVTVSSSYLKEKVLSRVGRENVLILNNAIDKCFICSKELINPAKNNEKYNILYFGTVSHWFDFDIILNILNIYHNIEITIIGPCEVITPKHERIRYVPPISHEKLKDYIKYANAFIMPFKVNELVKAVDPVKLYEYIAYGKPTFVIEYGETRKFKDYVFLYRNLNELSSRIKEAMVKNNDSISQKKINEFIKSNTWEYRVRLLIEYMKKDND